METRRKHGITGCTYLDEKGLGQGDGLARPELCLYSCPFSACLLDRNNRIILDTEGEEPDPVIVTLTVQCRECKTIETVDVIGGLLTSPYFAVSGSTVFHTKCSSPCMIIGSERG